MPCQRVLGLIGGLSWESSAEYYRILNETMRERLGALHSARCLIWSFDFAEIEALEHAGRWDEAAALMVNAARRGRSPPHLLQHDVPHGRRGRRRCDISAHRRPDR